MMKPKQNRRKWKSLLINPRYQLKYIFWTTVSGLFLVSVNAFVFYYYLQENYKILVELSPMEDIVKSQLYHELHEIIIILSCFGVLFTLVTALIGIFFSHRTAGPLYHFKRVFREISKGDASARVKLRPKDEFRDVAEEFNRMLDKLMSKKA